VHRGKKGGLGKLDEQLKLERGGVDSQSDLRQNRKIPTKKTKQKKDHLTSALLILRRSKSRG